MSTTYRDSWVTDVTDYRLDDRLSSVSHYVQTDFGVNPAVFSFFTSGPGSKREAVH
jgi:hypothetical protein